MHSCIFHHRSTRRSGGLHYLVLRFPARPFLGLVGEADSPPIMFTPTLWRGWHMPIGFFFKQVVFQTHSTFFENLRTTLHSWGSPFLIFFVRHSSRGGSKVVGWFSLTGNFLLLLSFPSTQSYRRSLLLFMGCSFTPLLSGGFLQALVCPKRFPVFSGLLNYQRDCSVPVSDFLGSLLPVFLFHRSATKNFYWDFLPDLQRAYFFGFFIFIM